LDLDKLISIGKRYGSVECVESYAEAENFIWEGEELKLSSVRIGNFSCRVLVEQKHGYSSTTHLGEKKACLLDAIKIAKASEKLEFDPGLPVIGKYKQVKNFSEKIEELSRTEIAELCKDCIQSIHDIDKKIKIPQLIFSKSLASVNFANSNGIFASDIGNSLGFQLVISLDQNSYFEIKNSREFDFDPVELCRNACETLKRLKKKKKIPSGFYDIVLEYFPASALIESILVKALCADNVQAGRSFLADKLRKVVASEELTVIDDGTLRKGLMTSKFDAEGVAMQRKILIKNGVLRGFIYDHYTARKEGRKSTGNCISLARRPSVGATNFMILPTKYELLEDFTGILIKSIGGENVINPISGEFSVNIDIGFFMKNGELKFPIKGCLMFGNFFEHLKEVEVGKGLRQEAVVATPPIRLKKVKIIA